MHRFQIIGRPVRAAAAAGALFATVAVLGGQLSLFALAADDATATQVARRAAAASELAIRRDVRPSRRG